MTGHSSVVTSASLVVQFYIYTLLFDSRLWITLHSAMCCVVAFMI